MIRLKFLFLLFLPVFGFHDSYAVATYSEASDSLNAGHVYVYDEFEFIEGVEVADIDFWQEWISGSYSRRRVIQLKDDAVKGHAEAVFSEPSAKYNITVTIVEAKEPDSELTLSLNGQKITTIGYGNSYSFKEHTIEDVNISQWSKLALEFSGRKNARCRVEKIVFTPVGAFEGQLPVMERPQTLKVFESYDEALKGRRMFHDYVMRHSGNADRMRREAIANSGTSKVNEPLGAKWQEEGVRKWKERQESVRRNLNTHFGEFPEKTPLNAKVVGKLEYEKYTIEKVIFESQPGFYVTANLYVPKDREFPVPGVVFPLGHSDAGKSRDVYHMSGLGMVLKGYVVLVFDPIGQGERSEYIDENNNWLVHLGVDQHWYVGRPAFLANQSLSGLRTWDGIRAVDYLVSRPEVDKDKLAAVGCSGGGQMALLITAVDERIKVCAASHPGGPMENAYLSGMRLPDKEIYSLIPPRPLRIIVGIESGEEPRHREYLEDMQIFYEGLRVGRQTAEIDVVPGPHSMNRSNRESAYEWLNKWFDKEAEGKAEDIPLKVETEEDLWCTESGNVLKSLGSETGQSLNARHAAEVYNPARDPETLKNNVARRIGWYKNVNDEVPIVKSYGLMDIAEMSVEKLTYQSEPGILVPALLLKPEKVKRGSPVFFYVSENGKPRGYQNDNIPFWLANEGYVVFAVDVRGTGETSPTSSFSSGRYTGYNPLLRTHDDLAIRSIEFGKTTLGMRSFDVVRGLEVIKADEDLSDKNIVAIGEGIGGLWTLTAAAFDERIEGIVTIGTLPSYFPLLENKYYNNVWGYFWLPGALKDFDIPDLAKLSTTKTQLWIDPINHLGQTDLEGAKKYLIQDNLSAVEASGQSIQSKVKLISEVF